MKRKILIITIIILLIALVVGGLWFFARNKATKNNMTPPTFKEFLGIGVSTKSTTKNTDNTESSDFTTTTNNGKTVTQNTNKTSSVNNVPITSSVFTNSGVSIDGTSGGNDLNNIGFGEDLGNGGSFGGDGGLGGGNTGGGNSGGGGVVPLPPVTAPIAQCSSEDSNITFTPEEINKLNVLKNRFYAIAETLHTDTDVASELANYDSFKARLRKITELYDYCKNSPVYATAQATVVASQPYGTVVSGTNGAINYRVPTPFWHDLTKDNQAFVHQGTNWQGIFSDPDSIFPERSIEHALRINLW